MKKIITNVIFISMMTIASVFSLSYYTLKFYPYHKSIFIWAILLTIVIITLLLGLYNAYTNNKTKKQNDDIKRQNDEIKKQNEELTRLIKELKQENKENCNNILEATYNSRDISLDIYNESKERK